MPAVTNARATGLSIGELSRRSGVNIETIRYYEKIGVLPMPSRSANGRRTYHSKETRMLAFVRRARELGFSLEEIRALLNLGAPASASCAEVREIAARHVRDIRQRIADLNKLDALLSKTIRRCSGKAVPECPIIDVLDLRPAAKET